MGRYALRATANRLFGRLGLTAKLFLAILAAMLIAIAATLVAARISFVQGFLGYLNEQELERIEVMQPLLARAYAEHGSWDFLREDPGAWIDLSRGEMPGDGPLQGAKPLQAAK